MAHVLPDLLAPGLTTVFCGSAAGRVSALRRTPYSGPGNKFWPTLAATGMTPGQMDPQDYRGLLELGIGLTDLNKTQSGSDASLSPAADDCAALKAKIERTRPAIVAFTAKRPAGAFLGACFGTREIGYGRQPQTIGGTVLFVLPSPSGLAIRWWEPAWWHRLAALHHELCQDPAVSAASSAARPSR